MSGCGHCPICAWTFDRHGADPRAAADEMLRLGPEATQEHLLTYGPRCPVCRRTPMLFDGAVCDQCRGELRALMKSRGLPRSET